MFYFTEEVVLQVEVEVHLVRLYYPTSRNGKWKIKITKQGEAISDNFTLDLAETNLKIILNAMLEASIKEPSIKKDEA